MSYRRFDSSGRDNTTRAPSRSRQHQPSGAVTPLEQRRSHRHFRQFRSQAFQPGDAGRAQPQAARGFLGFGSGLTVLSSKTRMHCDQKPGRAGRCSIRPSLRMAILKPSRQSGTNRSRISRTSSSRKCIPVTPNIQTHNKSTHPPANTFKTASAVQSRGAT